MENWVLGFDLGTRWGVEGFGVIEDHRRGLDVWVRGLGLRFWVWGEGSGQVSRVWGVGDERISVCDERVY